MAGQENGVKSPQTTQEENKMKKFKKIITATAAAFAVIATVVTTTSFAVSDTVEAEVASNAVDAVDTVDTVYNQTPGNYMFFNWGMGYAETTNVTANYRRCSAEVIAYSNLTGKQVDRDTDTKDCNHNESAYAEVSSKYISSNYNYSCSGFIRGSASSNATIIESASKLYPIP